MVTLEIVDNHNKMVDKMWKLADAIIYEYPSASETSVNEAYFELRDAIDRQAVVICEQINDLGLTVVDGYITMKQND
jgi:hypothetical protein